MKKTLRKKKKKEKTVAESTVTVRQSPIVNSNPVSESAVEVAVDASLENTDKTDEAPKRHPVATSSQQAPTEVVEESGKAISTKTKSQEENPEAKSQHKEDSPIEESTQDATKGISARRSERLSNSAKGSQTEVTNNGVIEPTDKTSAESDKSVRKEIEGSKVVSARKELSNPKHQASRKVEDFGSRTVIDPSKEKEDETKEETAAETTKEEDSSHGEFLKKSQGRFKEEYAATRYDSAKNQADESRQVNEDTKKATSKGHATVQPKTTPARRSLRLRRKRKEKETNVSEEKSNEATKVTAKTQTRQVNEEDSESKEEEQEYVIDRIVSHFRNEDAGHKHAKVGDILYTVRWYGCDASEDTDEPIQHLPRNKVTSYYKRKGLPIPSSVQKAQMG